MRRAVFVALVLVAVPFHPVTARDSLAQPSPNLLFQLQKQNRSYPWLHVATDSARLTLKVRRIDDLGLHGLTASDGAPSSPEALTWLEIERIDAVVTRAHQGRVMGTIVLGLAGAGLGNALGAPDSRGGRYALLGLAALGGVGGWLGGKYGERFKHERNWYVADTAARTLSAASLAPAAAVAIVAPTPHLTTSPAAIQASNRIGENDVIRVTGSFGRFQGYAGLAGPAGLESLHLDPKARGEWAEGKAPERISWESIDEVRMRGGSARMGALSGAASFALFGALLGAAAVAVADGNASVGTGALAGAGILAPFGALIGAGAGSLARRWVVVYRAE